MDIFEFAMQMEKDGEKYYRDLAEKVSDEGVSRIFLMMADDEVKHYNIFANMKSGTPEMESTLVLTKAKNIFKEMSISKGSFDFDIAQKDALQKALEIEERSEKFYNEKANEVNSKEQKALLLKIAGEERKHVHLLDHMIEFFNRPSNWLDNAEFTHLDEY
jgi:rubrerythrin